VEELLNDTGHRIEGWLRLSEKTFEFACTARRRFATGDLHTKKDILSTIGANLTLKDKKLFIEAKTPFFILETSKSGVVHNPPPIERDNSEVLQRDNRSRRSKRLRLLGDVDDVRTYGRKEKQLIRALYHFFRST